MSDVLLSIKPRFADAILSGHKTVELRKTSARLSRGTRVYIYASSPRRAVVGEAVVVARHQLPLDRLWTRFGSRASVTEAELRAYYDGADEGVVFELESVRRYHEPITLHELRRLREGFRPPQSYMRAPAFLLAAVERRFAWALQDEAHQRLGA